MLDCMFEIILEEKSLTQKIFECNCFWMTKKNVTLSMCRMLQRIICSECLSWLIVDESHERILQLWNDMWSFYPSRIGVSHKTKFAAEINDTYHFARILEI